MLALLLLDSSPDKTRLQSMHPWTSSRTFQGRDSSVYDHGGSVLWLSSMCDARHRQQSACMARLTIKKGGRCEAKVKRRLDGIDHGVMEP